MQTSQYLENYCEDLFVFFALPHSFNINIKNDFYKIFLHVSFATGSKIHTEPNSYIHQHFYIAKDF